MRSVLRIVHSRADEPYTPEHAAGLDAMIRTDEEIRAFLKRDEITEIETIANLEELATRESMR